MNMEIRQSIGQGFTIVTPTRRLGRALQQQYISDQLSAQKQVWETPDILPWAGWMLRTWDDFAAQQKEVPMLLNSQQQQWVWQQIVADSRFAEGLLQPAAAASKDCAFKPDWIVWINSLMEVWSSLTTRLAR